MASSWFRQNGVTSSRPPAGNAHRWAHAEIYNRVIQILDNDGKCKKELPMNFFKKLFSKEEPKEESYEPYVPTPTQQIPGLEPIAVQAIEYLFASTEDQKQAFEFSIRYKQYQTSSDNLVLLLALLSYSDGKIEKLLALEPDAIGNYQFMLDEIAPRFPSLKAAEKWVKSMAKS